MCRSNYLEAIRRNGRVAMQRIANPSTSVRLRVPPPFLNISTCESKPDARVVELVDTRDLKSLAGNSVPVQVRPRAPFVSGFVCNKSKWFLCTRRNASIAQLVERDLAKVEVTSSNLVTRSNS